MARLHWVLDRSRTVITLFICIYVHIYMLYIYIHVHGAYQKRNSSHKYKVPGVVCLRELRHTAYTIDNDGSPICLCDVKHRIYSVIFLLNKFYFSRAPLIAHAKTVKRLNRGPRTKECKTMCIKTKFQFRNKHIKIIIIIYVYNMLIYVHVI